ncbi:MAG TPA: TOBE domain-containing protein, partial [Chromatiales bacterium]|nr:TOBE domain-containing protein [Chromatiales bacterium]
PLSNLDAKLRVQIRAEIARLQRRLGTTTLYVTHDQVEAMTLGDRVAVLDAGQLQQVGAPQALYERPANVFVASFLGNPGMNILRAVIDPEEKELQLGGGALRIPLGMVLAHHPRLGEHRDRPLLTGLRPEAFSTQRTDIALEVTVETVEAMGHERLVYFTLTNAGPDTEPGTFVARLPGSHAETPGQRITLGFGPEHFHFFTQAGRAII